MNDSYYYNKNILLIGGSFGIGEQLCIELANMGAKIAIVARSKEKINKLKNELHGDKHLAISCDISKKSDLDNLHKELKNTWQSIDIIIFCAGYYEPMNITNFDLARSKEIVNTNFYSLLNFIDIFKEDLIEEKIANLAIVASVAGYFGMPNSMAYGASKAATINLTESLFYELKKYNTKVKLINPGFVQTRLTDKNSFKMPLIISAKKAAKIIIKNLPKNKFEIKFPFMFALLMKFIAILPYRLQLSLLKNIK